MLFAEPPRTPYDLNFFLGRIPVRVHPLFWLVTLLLGAGGGTSPLSLLTWIAVVFVSIVVHELGHALVMRYYGWQPSIILYQLGGLATYNPGFTPAASSYRRRGNTPLAQIAISVAGPAAGFLFAGLVILGLLATGHSIEVLGVPFGRGVPIPAFTLPAAISSLARPSPNPTFFLLHDLLYVNIGWGLINLLPIYPLDGGQISRELFLVANRADGVRQSLVLSIVTAAGLAVLAMVSYHDLFLALLFGFLAYNSYTMLQGYGSGGFGRPW